MTLVGDAIANKNTWMLVAIAFVLRCSL